MFPRKLTRFHKIKRNKAAPEGYEKAEGFTDNASFLKMLLRHFFADPAWNSRFVRLSHWVPIFIVLGSAFLITATSFYYYNESAFIFFVIFLAYLLHGVLYSVFLLFLSYMGLRAFSVKRNPIVQTSRLTVSVVIPAFNEAHVIVSCVESILRQTVSPDEIWIVNDGSTDETMAVLRSTYNLQSADLLPISSIPSGPITGFFESLSGYPIRVIDKANRGKADALNAALNFAGGSIFITVDADSFLHSKAIQNITEHLSKEEAMVAAGGIVRPIQRLSSEILEAQSPPLPPNWLTRLQWLEYAIGFIWRFGWQSLNTLLLISGSFTTFRTSILRECKGFDPRSLVEDYEIAYRLHTIHRAFKKPYRIVTVPNAVCYTLVPETLRALVRQRIRWFQGFLYTLMDYRYLILNRDYGALGCFMLPLKTVDALLPLWGVFAYLALVLHLIFGHYPLPFEVLGALVGLLFALNMLICWILLFWDSRFIAQRLPAKQIAVLVAMTPLYLVTKQLIWYISSIYAYSRILRKVRRWDKSRQPGVVPATNAFEA